MDTYDYMTQAQRDPYKLRTVENLGDEICSLHGRTGCRQCTWLFSPDEGAIDFDEGFDPMGTD